MKIVPLEPSAAFPLRPNEARSFRGRPSPCRISGPFKLVRLVSRGGSKDGAFWFEEAAFKRLRDQARRDLAAQNPGQPEPFSIPMRDMIGLYMKHCLRSDLAICKNWTQNFDSYAVLSLGAADSLTAWMGRIASQPYYAKPDPAGLSEAEYAAQLAIYEKAEAGGVSLLGRGNQYVIHFDYSANRSLVSRISGPWPF